MTARPGLNSFLYRGGLFVIVTFVCLVESWLGWLHHGYECSTLVCEDWHSISNFSNFSNFRIWGAHGQEAIEKSHICVLDAGPTSSETLKNLVLPSECFSPLFLVEQFARHS